MEPSLAMISHIAQDFFYFKNLLNKNCPNGTTLSTCDIKSLYTNNRHDRFMHQLDTGLKNCKMVYRYYYVLINKLSLKARRLFQNSIIFTQIEFIFIRLRELQWIVIQLQHTKKSKCLHYFHNYTQKIYLNFFYVTTFGFQTMFFINDQKILTLNPFIT